MRRLKPVCIMVSNNFYRELEKQRILLKENLKRKTGIDKNISIVATTEIIAKNRRVFPKINLGGIFSDKRKKSRCF